MIVYDAMNDTAALYSNEGGGIILFSDYARHPLLLYEPYVMTSPRPCSA